MAVNLAEGVLKKAGKEPMAKQLANAAISGAVKGAKAGALGGAVKGAETGAAVGVKRAIKNAGVSKPTNAPSSKSNTTHNKVLDNSITANKKKTAVDKGAYDTNRFTGDLFAKKTDGTLWENNGSTMSFSRSGKIHGGSGGSFSSKKAGK